MPVETLAQPQAPAAARAPARPWSARLVPAIIFAVGAPILALSAYLTPDPTGVGTHQQLHLPPCGFLMATGYPCPTCGYTTAFALAAHGRLGAALRTQPAGAVLVLAISALTLVSACALVTGASLAPLNRLFRPTLFLGAGALVLGAWVYKIVQMSHTLHHP
jgi:hypothetical protein